MAARQGGAEIPDGTLTQGLRPFLVAMKVTGLYREGHVGYMALSAANVVSSLLGLIRVAFTMAGVPPGLHVQFMLLFTAVSGTVQNLLTSLIYFYHNLQGTHARLLTRMEASMRQLNCTLPKRVAGGTWVVLIGCIGVVITYSVCCLAFGYLAGRTMQGFFLYPGGAGFYVGDALVFLLNAITMFTFTFTTLFNMLLIVVPYFLFKHVTNALAGEVDSMTGDTLERYRCSFTDLCGVLDDVNRLLSPCVGLGLAVQIASQIFLCYGLVFLDQQAYEDINMPIIYLALGMWLGTSVTMVCFSSLAAVWLNDQVNMELHVLIWKY